MTIQHQPDHSTHETESIRRFAAIAAARGWQFDVEPITRFAARITLPGGRRHPLIGADLGLNSSSARRVAEDKAFAAGFLERDGLPVVPTFVVRDAAHARAIVEAEGLGAGLVVKPNRGHGARGLTFVHSLDELPGAIERARAIDPVVLLQPRDPRTEFRILLCAGHVATFEKRPVSPDAPGNLATGATWTDRTRDTAQAYVQLAERARRSLGLALAAVDIFTSDTASFDQRVSILEVNATPGWKALTTIPGALDRLLARVADVIEGEGGAASRLA